MITVPTTPEEVADFLDELDEAPAFGPNASKASDMYDRIAARIGEVSTIRVWQRGCDLYDVRHAEPEPPAPKLRHEPVPDGHTGPWNRKPHTRSYAGPYVGPSTVSTLTFDPRCGACLAGAQ